MQVKFHNTQHFKGLLHIDHENGSINDSWFFRDEKTIKDSTSHIKSNFPHGTNILDYASSTGEEIISIKCFLPEQQYKLIGYDTSTDAVKLGRKGIYSVFSHWYDSYLLPHFQIGKKAVKLDDQLQELKNKFYSVMEKVHTEPEFLKLNNKVAFIQMRNHMPDFVEKFFTLKDEYKGIIDLRLGNIINIGKYRGEKPVGAAFFRNAAYHLCGNNITEVIEQLGTKPNSSISSRFNILNYIAQGAHKILDDNGIFVIGNNIKDHLFLADKSLSPDEIIKFKDTPFFNPNLKSHIRKADLECAKESPLLKAFRLNNFEPIGFSNVEFGGLKIKVPTIWKKIRF